MIPLLLLTIIECYPDPINQWLYSFYVEHHEEVEAMYNRVGEYESLMEAWD